MSADEPDEYGNSIEQQSLRADIYLRHICAGGIRPGWGIVCVEESNLRGKIVFLDTEACRGGSGKGNCMKKKKSKLSLILLIVIFLAGIFLLLYPSVSDWWNSFHQSRAIASYVDAVENLDEQTYAQIIADAQVYNQRLNESNYGLALPDSMQEEYESQLNIDGSGIMGYITIDKIDCELPIYHGTDDGVLQIAVGHIDGSSLPVGGESTHCVLSGHRGLPSAQLFSKLDKMEVGDKFVIQTLNETLTYEVDLISIVLPNETDLLQVEEGEDLCTLMTCTPYGVNTHRLLVRGHRVANEEDANINVTSEAVQIDTTLVAPVIAAPLLLILLIWLLVRTRRKNQKKDKDEVENEDGKKEKRKKKKKSRG